MVGFSSFSMPAGPSISISSVGSLIRKRFYIFRRSTKRVFFKDGRKIAACAKPQMHGDICYGHNGLQQQLGLLDFLLVYKTSGGNAQLPLEFLFKLGAGKICQRSKLFQGKLRSNVVEDIVQCFSNVRRQSKLFLI